MLERGRKTQKAGGTSLSRSRKTFFLIRKKIGIKRSYFHGKHIGT
jgi:hypothetical protein